MKLERFLRILQERDWLLTEFDEKLWKAVVEKVAVKSDTLVVVIFCDGAGGGAGDWKGKTVRKVRQRAGLCGRA